jgi:hypothetical protein
LEKRLFCKGFLKNKLTRRKKMLRKSFYGFVVVFILCLGVASTGQCTATLSHGGTGDVLLNSLYDVRALTERAGAPWENYITIENTANAWVAAHVRFRSANASIEVWDHIILLSPFDVLWLDLKRDTNGGVTIFSSDTQTLKNSGIIRQDATSYSGKFSTALLDSCGYSATSLADSEMGYVEVIGLWQIANTSHSIAAIAYDSYNDPGDVSGAINVYDVLFTIWGNVASPNGRIGGDRFLPLSPASPLVTTDVNYALKSYPLIDCDNVLQGSMEQGDVVTGAYQLNNFVSLANFRTTSSGAGIFHRDGNTSGVIAYPLATLISGTRAYTTGLTGLIANAGNEVAWYCNEDVTTTAGPTLRDGDSATDYLTALLSEDAGFSAEWSLYEVENALRKTTIWAYYMNSTSSTAPFFANITTDIVLTFPTKHSHFFFNGWTKGSPAVPSGFSIYLNTGGVPPGAASARWPFWNGPSTLAVPRNYTLGSYTNLVNTDRGLLKGKYDAIFNGPYYINGGTIFDTAQNTLTGSPEPSPSPFSISGLPYEVNVLRVGPSTSLFSTSFIHGQLFITNWLLGDPDPRGNESYLQAGAAPNATASYPLYTLAAPIIGQSIRAHTFPTSAFVRRTCSAPLQYTYAPGLP